MWRRPLEWNLNGTTDPLAGSVDHLSLNSLKDRHGPIRAPKSLQPNNFLSRRHFALAARQCDKAIMGTLASSQPAFAALVRLHVLERAPIVARHAEIEFAHVLVGAQRLGRAVEHDPAGFENIAETRVAERNVGVLLGEQERDALALIEALHDLEDLLDHLRGEAHRRLVGAGRASASTSSPGRSGTSAARRRRYSPP